MTTEATAQDAKKADRKTTEYVVLMSDTSEPGWVEYQHNPVRATSAPEAMKTAGADAPAEVFVAVPARSWKPLRRSVEQVTKETWF